VNVVAADVLRGLVAQQGGFTVELRTGTPVRRGISVCTRPTSSVVFPWSAWNDSAVEAWLVACTTVIGTRSSHSAYVGGWRDPVSDEVWLDIVSVVASVHRHAAVELARTLRQYGVFDLDRRELVDLRSSAA
jgi:hypothetical protein